jgi:two-component system, OmpR family, sensor histidine kinase CiaH
LKHKAHRYWRSFVQFSRSTTARLSLSYLAIIMLMSIGFSIVFYNTSSHELGRPVPPPGDSGNAQDMREFRFNKDPDFRDFIATRNATVRLITLNALALVAGAGVSYYLARRTLEPIEANMDAQAQFVSDASHELRTPLTSLQATNEVALRRTKLTVAEAREVLQGNIEEVQKLKELTDGLLKLAKQDGQQLKLSLVSVQDVAADALNAIVQRAQAKNISVHDEVAPLKVHADTPSLTQALVALLDNAIKYSSEGSTIGIRALKQGSRVLIQITDQGRGIDQKDLPRIFDRFYRADQARSQSHVDGYGIGLAIVKKIITHHNGTVTVISKPNHGTTFTVSLPAA